MSRHELAAYAKQYFPADMQQATQDAWDARLAQNPDEVRRIGADFYDQMARYHEEDMRAFDVQALAEDHDVALVSAIRTYGNLGPFRPLDTKAFKGVRLFDILLRPGQIVCGSSVMEGDSSANLYGNWGVIIGSGTVSHAFPYDATTSVSQGVVHSRFAPRLDEVRPTEQMMHSLHARRLYNEIDVSLDSIAGMYYCDDGDGHAVGDYPAPAFLDVIEPLAIPQYALRGGKFYPMQEAGNLVSASFNDPKPVVEILRGSVLPSTEQTAYMADYLSEMLTLAPRNAITSGVVRGEFAYDYNRILPPGRENFLAQHERLLAQKDNPSLQLYGAMALHAFAESAAQDGEHELSARASTLAVSGLSTELYKEYKARILPTGNLAITRDDLQHYMDHEVLPPYLGDH